jgi:hypothetical protein
VKTSLGAPHTFSSRPGSELVSFDTIKWFAAQAKIVRSSATIVRSTTRQAKIKGVEFFSGASENQSTVRHLSILNFHCTVGGQIKLGHLKFSLCKSDH